MFMYRFIFVGRGREAVKISKVMYDYDDKMTKATSSGVANG